MNQQTLGRYTLLRRIGSGAMGDVYAAMDPELQRPVALKVLRPELADRPDLAKRFEREARAIAALEHPNIVSIHSVEAADGVPFLTMELIEGQSLEDRIGKRKLSVRELLDLGIQIADAVAAAHERGITHRDLKPGNVMITNEGRIKVLDFGLAKKLLEDSGDSARTFDNRLTSEGAVIGTASYMSPEQAQGLPVDQRSDIFSLGVMLYEMAAGELPFCGDSRIATLAAIINDAPRPITHHNPTLPRHLDRIITLALEKDREHRLQSAKDLRNELEQLLREITTAHSQDQLDGRQLPRARARPLLAAALFGVAAGAAAMAWLMPGGVATIELGRISRITGAPELEVHPAISPNGEMVVYSAGPTGARRLFSRSTAAGKEILLTGELDGDLMSPTWSSDGRQVGFCAEEKCWVASPLGGGLRVLANVSASRGLSFSPDGSRVVCANNGGLVSCRLADGEQVVLVAQSEISAPSWSPDGARIAFVVGNPQYAFSRAQIGNIAESSIWLVAAAGGEPVRVIEGRLNSSPVWRDDDQILFVSNRDGGRDVYSIGLDTDGRAAGPPRRLTTGLDVHTFSLSANGTRMAFSEFRSRANIWSLPIPTGSPVSTSEAEPVTRGNQSIEGIGVSTDGELLLFDSNVAGNQDIYRLELSTGALRQLTVHGRDEFMAQFSPDRQEIAFYSFRTGNRDLFVMSADGSGIQQVTSDPAQDRYPNWSPDGNRLAFYSDRTGGQEIWVTTRAAKGATWGPPEQWTLAGGQYGHWSGDGNTLLYGTNDQLWTISAPGEAPHPLLPKALVGPDWPFPNWSLDCLSVYFKVTGSDGRDGIWTVPATGGNPVQLVIFDRLSARNEFATDGRRFYFTITEQQSDIFTMDLR